MIRRIVVILGLVLWVLLHIWLWSALGAAIITSIFFGALSSILSCVTIIYGLIQLVDFVIKGNRAQYLSFDDIFKSIGQWGNKVSADKEDQDLEMAKNEIEDFLQGWRIHE